jgi:hypothetical protein
MYRSLALMLMTVVSNLSINGVDATAIPLLSDDFDHPLLPLGHPRRRHVLDRLVRQSSAEWTSF